MLDFIKKQAKVNFETELPCMTMSWNFFCWSFLILIKKMLEGRYRACKK